jgi:hypothetical protein
VILVTAALLLLAAAITAADWRRAIFVAVPVAMVQDPLRKLVEGQPVAYVVLVGVVVCVGTLVAAVSGVTLTPGRIWGWRRSLGTPLAWLIAIICVQAINSFIRFGNPIIPAIGLLTYAVPLLGLCLLYQTIVRSPDDFVTKFLQFYVLCVSLVLPSIALEYVGYRWPVLGEVGWGITIWDQGTVMKAYSGLFRASEIAAWHAGAAACFAIILIVVNRGMAPGRAIWWAAGILIIIGLGVLTGRRKFLIEIVVFGSAYVTLLLVLGRGLGRLALVSCLIGFIGFIGLIFLLPEEKKEVRPLDVPYQLYLQRTKSGFGDIPDRFWSMGVAPITWAYDRYGLLGAGLGAGAQGTQHFGGPEQGAGEGGLGKIWLELGAPGFVIVIWFCWALARHLWMILKIVNRQSAFLSRLTLGLMSFVIANVATFTVATQAFGDLFILLLLGTSLGALLAMPVLGERALQRRILSLRPDYSRTLLPHPASARGLNPR